MKIADFGCTKHVEGTQLQTHVGTNGYMAPEIWGLGNSESSVYSDKVDMWSLGCLIYAVLTKAAPFPEFRDFMGYIGGYQPFPKEKLLQGNVTEAGIKFIINLMTPEPGDRPSVDQALQHAWLTLHPMSGDNKLEKEGYQMVADTRDKERESHIYGYARART